jgi:hypothetical protein
MKKTSSSTALNLMKSKEDDKDAMNFQLFKASPRKKGDFLNFNADEIKPKPEKVSSLPAATGLF